MPNPFCKPCGHKHGPLYICEHYSPERKAETATAAEKWRLQLMDPEWVKGELKRGIPPEAISIMRWFAGLDPSSGENN
jgi:hypothetical protein